MIFFRTDSNEIIAGGHVMRCMAIANELVEIGVDVCFLIADNNPVPLIEGAGLSYIVLESDWRDLMTDIEKTKGYISKYKNAFLLIDTYSVNRKYVDELKKICQVGYIGSKKEYLGNLDLLINYSSVIDYYFYKSNYSACTKLLLGVAYAPLRNEFQEYEPRYNKRLKRILLTTGNTYKDNIIEEILNEIRLLIKKYDIEIDVVIGTLFGDKKKIYEEYKKEKNINLKDNVSYMYELMKTADIAISASGTTIYELAAMGVPTLSFAMVEEQMESAISLGKLGVIDYCGESYLDSKLCAKKIRDRLEYYIENDEKRVLLAKKAHKLMDGNGCARIVKAIQKIK